MLMVVYMSQPESNWEKYKVKTSTKQAKPWHVLNPNLRIDEESVSKRMAICSQCDRYIRATTQCKECGCIMLMKTKLSNAICPLGKW
jgi:ribosomal protein L32